MSLTKSLKECACAWYLKCVGESFTSVRSTPILSTLSTRPMAESCDISFKFILFLLKVTSSKNVSEIEKTRKKKTKGVRFITS
jgi:hypothetical protein